MHSFYFHMGTLSYFMKCKRDVVVGTHPEDIASNFCFCATGDQTNLNLWSAVESKMLLNVKMFYIGFNIEWFFLRDLDFFSNWRSPNSRSSFHFRHLNLRTSFKNTEYPCCIKNVRFFFFNLCLNIRTTDFVFTIFYKMLLFCCICCTGQDFQNEILADNPCHYVFFLTFRGDYRTGKRLNMRKVIPYIASQFRKDKIWLRRTKPSKRQYQICLAIDDSSSMIDNHSKQVK